MNLSNRSVRWLQIILTLFYGQVISTGIYEYIIQGICGLILRFRPIHDSIILIILGLFMFIFVLYAIFALWYCRLKMFTVSLLILIAIFILTLVKSIVEIRYMGRNSMRIEWTSIRITELVLRVFGIVASVLFIVSLRQGYKPDIF
ncbi:unnamed protein product [Rotaria sp. Silwood1]|nr:unnamed protein product [Rotaria sp. Silwood1]CAF1046549.1 unnamed protein product [Rotaria sp. Silwood1]CAF1067341.1 unnamed protein product [Rotaria sp. Silwood1]CAF3400044.1 unnamed protein product [Rotaria sp. Silwood1]CAF3420386.1 unnamed protein product [Rotaria sp. Silwood1]